MKKLYLLLVLGLLMAAIAVMIFMRAYLSHAVTIKETAVIFLCDAAAFTCAGVVLHEMKDES